MMEEWVDELLSDAQNLLNKIVIFPFPESLPEVSLEYTCTCFLLAFRESAEIRYFEGIYKLTYPLFTWQARRFMEEESLCLEPELIANRFYAFLAECINHPDYIVPLDNLFGWCYRSIENIARLESQSASSQDSPVRAYDLSLIYPTPTEAWLRERHLTERDYIEEQIMETLFGEDCVYTPLEKNILNLYYVENLSLSTIALKLRLSDEKASDLLRGCIFRIVQKLPIKSSDQLQGDLDKEERE